MFQDIDPHALSYDPDHRGPDEGGHVLFLQERRVLLAAKDGSFTLPKYGEVRHVLQGDAGGVVYLFSVDGAAFYYAPQSVGEMTPFVYENISVVRNLKPRILAFASATAFHIADWYGNNRYCGRCAGPMRQKGRERALHCPRCAVVKYPRISPAVIVGITDGDELLLAKYSDREYKNYGLIAGFVEPGETLEMAIAREVMEEVGLRVTNVRYYKSQPWAFSQSILMGFFADLQGERAITIDPRELSEAGWFSRADIPADESRFSLTWDMIQAFRNGEL